MSFIRTSRNISAIPKTGCTAEQLFGVVIDLIRDIYDEAGVKKASALPVNEKKKLLTTMHSLSKVIVDVYVYVIFAVPSLPYFIEFLLSIISALALESFIKALLVK